MLGCVKGEETIDGGKSIFSKCDWHQYQCPLCLYQSVFKEIYKYKQERDINITLEILVLTEHDCNLVNKAIDRKCYV